MARAVIDRVFERRLAALVNTREHGAALAGGRRGLEREGLRITPEGRVSARAHPQALGSALCNPHITTDYSESLLELVTPTFTDNAALSQYLADLHHFVARHLDGELLWAGSMPGEIAGEAEVPIARYGRSHRGHFKEVYRRGLQTRYGGLMQAIAGAHFNFSFPDRFWPLWAEVLEKSSPRIRLHLGGLLRPGPQLPPSRVAGACTCSACRRQCAPASCRLPSMRNSKRSVPARCTCRMRPRCA